MNHTRIYSLQGCGDWVYNHFLSTKLQRWQWWTPKASWIPSWFLSGKEVVSSTWLSSRLMNFKWNYKWCIKTSSNVNQNCSACPARNFLYQMPEAKRPLFLAKWHFAGKLVWIAVVNVSCQNSKDSRLFSKQYRNARTVDFLKVRLVEAI